MVPPSILIPHTPRREGPRSERSLLTAFPLSPTYQRLTRSARGCRRFWRALRAVQRGGRRELDEGALRAGAEHGFRARFFLRRAFKNVSRVPRGRALLRFGKKEVFMLELSQGVRGVRFAYADGVSDFVTKEGIISRVQDVTEIIRQNRAEQNIQRCGFQKAPTFRKVASIPVTVVDMAAAQGLDILNDPDAMRRFLNDPDNRAFRTTLERV